jgi:hypothetical protein
MPSRGVVPPHYDVPGTGAIEKGRTMVDAPRSVSRTDVSSIRTVTTVVSVVFLLVGIAGFIPGITTHYGDLSFAGHDSGAKLLGVFQVSILHNIVHLLYGVVGLIMARTVGAARAYLIGGGVVYLVLWIYGLVTDKMSSANFVPINRPDDWLHFVLGVAMIGLGVALGRRYTTR